VRRGGTRRIIISAWATIGVLGSAPAMADFPDRDITVIIPYSAGGGFDSYVRAVLPALENYLPNDVHVVPKNVPGAGGRKGATAIFRARPDGYTLGAFNIPGLLLPQLRGDRVAYDLAAITWLGRISEDHYALVVAGSSAIRSVEDLRGLNRPVKFTATGVGSTAHVVSTIATAVLGVDARFITGYEGSQNYILAVARGDGDAAIAAAASVGRHRESGDLRVIASFENHSSFAEAQTATALGRPELTRLALQRVVGAPPDLPDDVRVVLADALAMALADPELSAWSERVNMPLAPLSADDTAALVIAQQSFYDGYREILAGSAAADRLLAVRRPLP
jgi:tripartite-type tricarboxylate transporter receptor subunit TctC